MVPWAHMSHPPNSILVFLAVFAGTIRVTNTLTMLRATSVAIGHIYAMREMRPNDKCL